MGAIRVSVAVLASALVYAHAAPLAAGHGLAGRLPKAFPNTTWETVPIFAFPGCSPRFMNATQAGYFANNFANLLIWGVNATCMAANGTAYEAACASSRCYCDEADPESQTWVLNMEQSLQAQSAALKAAVSGNRTLPVLGYIEGLSAQQYYVAQSEFMTNPQYASLLLAIDSIGVIDCYHNGCNWQGVEYRQYDLRQQAARDYYVQNVIGSLINDSRIDGTFVDVIDWWMAVCGSRWTCTADETAALFNASLAATTQALQLAAAQDKLLSISAHSTSESAYYAPHIAILRAFPGHAARFYEFFTAQNVFDVITEAQTYGLALHVHTAQRTMAPDWVELAAFLIAANARSWFSYSQGAWMFDSFPMQPEFTLALGAPLGPPANVTNVTAYGAWALLPAVNLIFDLPPAPNASVSGVLAWLGALPDAASCVAAARANASYVAVTYVDASVQRWGPACYARYDAAFNASQCIGDWNSASPCWAAREAGCTSAVGVAVNVTSAVLQRQFEHLTVTLDTGSWNATLQWH